MGEGRGTYFIGEKEPHFVVRLPGFAQFYF
jgi:hypothetical protein